MKKMIIAILMALCVVSGLSAVEYTVIETRDYSPVVLGANLVIKPAIYTGGDVIARNEFLKWYYDTSSLGTAFRRAYDFDDTETKQSNLSVALQGYVYGALDKKNGIGADVSCSFMEGYCAQFEYSNYRDSVQYQFTTTEIFPHYRYYFANGREGWVACKAGPNIAVTSDTTKYKVGDESVPLSEKIQNDILYGIRAGFDAGLYMGKWLMSYDFSVSYDLNPAYNPDATSGWFSENVGNRISFNIGFGYGLKF